jgi:uncharacterized membrane protein YqjE
MASSDAIPPAPGQAAASTVALLRELARDAVQYARDWGELFAAELNQDSRSLRRLALMLGAGLLLLWFSFALLTAALVGVVALALASWRWSLLVVGAAYGLAALGCLAAAAAARRSGLLQFRHIRRRLREDRAWIKDKMAA